MGVHPNTVRLYEDLELIAKPKRQANGYRVFTDLHLEQFRLARLAFQIEVLQNGLRKKLSKWSRLQHQAITIRPFSILKNIYSNYKKSEKMRKKL
ncbi:MerR family DNA-binding transcriptional regulator [Virgibacillus proomii]|uniref:MerR family DNA-binding transcriptional regulator n=1 Tax=Virgibacillus proomii TaxID=84407 RepID=UPI001FE6FE8D|nr:MerR family DNA-binding transcriptional regulator [Virgibacillus proomii]